MKTPPPTDQKVEGVSASEQETSRFLPISEFRSLSSSLALSLIQSVTTIGAYKLKPFSSIEKTSPRKNDRQYGVAMTELESLEVEIPKTLPFVHDESIFLSSNMELPLGQSLPKRPKKLIGTSRMDARVIAEMRKQFNLYGPS